MRGVPLAVPVAWSASTLFFLQGRRFSFDFGSDSQRHRRPLR